MFQKFYPSEDIRSTYDIDFERYYKEGYRGVIFDVDNTLVPHNAPADERAKKLFKRLDAMGMQYCFTSNNKEPRVKAFCEAVGGKHYVDVYAGTNYAAEKRVFNPKKDYLRPIPTAVRSKNPELGQNPEW